MQITDITLTRSALSARGWKLHIEIGGLMFDGWFDDLRGLLTAMQDAAVFFCYRAGKLSHKAANAASSRALAQNDALPAGAGRKAARASH
jgi:hypothetical protein